MTPRTGSVVAAVPYYRCRGYVRKAVVSLLEQTHPDIMVVVVNDGDPDPPWPELADISDPRLRRFDLSGNYGLYFAYGLLVQDADDWSAPDRLATLLGKARDDSAVAALSAQYAYRDGPRSTPEAVRYGKLLDAPVSRSFQFRGAHHGLFRIDALRGIGGYYGGLRVEYDTLVVGLLHLTGRVTYVDTPLYHRVFRPESLTQAPETGRASLFRLRCRETIHRLYEEVFDGCAEAVRRGDPVPTDVARIIRAHLDPEQASRLEAGSRAMAEALSSGETGVVRLPV
jgi:glycosyltransferase involved in cell wall biosynthesis